MQFEYESEAHPHATAKCWKCKTRYTAGNGECPSCGYPEDAEDEEDIPEVEYDDPYDPYGYYDYSE